MYKYQGCQRNVPIDRELESITSDNITMPGAKKTGDKKGRYNTGLKRSLNTATLSGFKILFSANDGFKNIFLIFSKKLSPRYP
jgi:hypothetical protein